MSRLFTLLCFFLILFSAWGKCAWESKEALSLAKTYTAENKLVEAIPLYAKSIRWRVPFSSSWKESSEKLFLISSTDKEHELLALRELRSGLRSSRSFLHPEDSSELILKVDSRLKELNGERTVNETKPPHENYAMQILAQIAFWIFILSIVSGIWRGTTNTGTFKRKPITASLLIASLSYILWLFALSRA